VDSQRSTATPDIILRLTDVLKRTGLSRSTIYNRIAKNEFQRQVSLGGRAVGWLNGEVENWINERILLRPGSPIGISEHKPHMENPQGKHSGKKGERRPTVNCVISVSNGSPDQEQLCLAGTKIYFDRNSGSFWLKLLPET